MRRAAAQESLVEAGRLLTGTLQVSEVLHRLSELVRTRLSADVVRILIAEGTPGRLRLEARSEEHTSELQSRLHLVCRLLLEKKKKTEKPTPARAAAPLAALASSAMEHT